MKEETKQITFEGQTYTVPTWVKYVARDEDGYVGGYENKPLINAWNEWVSDEGESLRLEREDTSWRDSLTRV
jgi:hypothetical protein